MFTVCCVSCLCLGRSYISVTDILNVEIAWLALIVGNLSKVERVRAEAERDIVGFAGNRHIVVGTSDDTDDSLAIVGKTVSCVEGELHIFSLTWLKNATHGQNVEHLIDRKVLLLFLLLFACVVSVDLLLLVNVGCVFQEAPLVCHGHLGDVREYEVLFLASVVQNASEIDLWRQNLQVREADLT